MKTKKMQKLKEKLRLQHIKREHLVFAAIGALLGAGITMLIFSTMAATSKRVRVEVQPIQIESVKALPVDSHDGPLTEDLRTK